MNLPARPEGSQGVVLTQPNRTSLHRPVQQGLPARVCVVDVRLVLDERLGQGLLPSAAAAAAAAAAAQSDVQRKQVLLVKTVDSDGELEGDWEEILVIQDTLSNKAPLT